MKKRKTKIYPFRIAHKELLKVCLCAFLMPTFLPEVHASTIPIGSGPNFETVQQQIKGAVLDNAGIPLAGVNVLLEGSTTGTQTDFDGNYTITASSGDVLVFSYIGMKTQSITVGASGTINVTMEEDAASLDEVVVIGYGTQKKSDLTGAVGSVSSAELQERPAASLTQSLSGKMPGVSVSINSGRPGGKSNIRIRGNSSVSLSNDPLYVVDGIILVSSGLGNNSSPIDYINPNDIASIEVLKDASATAIYGSRGANGVILVSTKRGSRSGGKISYDSYYSIGNLSRKVDVLNSEEFLMIEEVAYQNAEKYDAVGFANGKYTDPALKRNDPKLFDANGNPLYDTDWQDEVTRAAFTQNHQLSFTGGTEKGSYGAFLGYMDEEGIMKDSWLKRYSGRFVFDSNIRDWLKVGGSLSYNNQKERIIHASWVGRNMIENIPIVPVKYPDGSWASNADYPGMEGGPNPVRVGEEYKNFLRTNTILGNIFANITLAKGLDFRTSIGVNNVEQKTDEYAGRELSFIGTNTNGYAERSANEYTSWQFENYLTYNKEIADTHSITGLLGISWQHINNTAFSARAENFSDDFFSFDNLGAGSVVGNPTSSAFAYGLNSYFGRINYGLQNKYLLTVTGRVDGSSKFGDTNKYAFFPSAALAWKVSEENFLKESKTISNLKLRASYGVTGNSEIPAYGALPGLGNYAYVVNNSVVNGIGIDRLANPDLKWEKTNQVDAGIEVGLFDGRISFEADIYRKLTEDMLLNSPVPTSSGYASVFRNIGSMENKGIEFSLSTRNIATDNFSWDTDFNIAMNKNEVVALSGGSDIFSSRTIIREGEAVGSFFGLVNLGTWGSDEAEEAAKYFRLPGDVKIEDRNNDGVINQADRTIIGKGIPDGYGSLINTFRYKNFELLVDLQFQYGNDIMYITTRPQENRQGIANSLATVLDAWTPENQDTEIAQWRPVSAGYDNLDTSHMIQDGSFIRGRNLLLGYNFSPDISEKLKLSRLKIYTSVQNFFVSTKYEGYDPEVQTTDNTFGQGEVNFDQYPKPRVFMIGLNATF
ncbi:SusC/RagA family TonB-linked outer membrane protein [Zobellia galactanivorans]|uniref:SusC/RagA family TonB-linked outer membrane protein n=1 Tax=Zobellia galactanivorans (strain DSM 12802 / CCUG 47099 / CIP 106680 / NCIMB 13871 / Dsij) TaxID=63186 RepID=UPI001C0771B1|nr:TonB-dependent receptor [Zobellia galactanivorans]MBU3024130.1 TonB-dependent receptor [Zobellia galactanivorans]